jgi:2-C-methyl-D-erythritol 4-phosphate cytidylyltransferase
MNNYVIVVAGGSGTRMKSVVPKQFLELAGKPVLMHTIERFVAFDPAIKIILVLPEEHQSTWKGLCVQHAFTIKHSVVKGGETRFHSVKNGLSTISGDGIVAVHDGVRPLVSIATIQRCFDEARKSGNAIPCIPVHETVRQMEGEGSRLVDRSALRLIQTPQVFKLRLLQQAFNQEYQPFFTDDASVLENKGEKIHLVEGNRENIKITEPADLVLARSVLDAGLLE